MANRKAQMSEAALQSEIRQPLGKNRHSLWIRIWQNKYMYLMFLPLLVFYIIFAYAPMGGIILAFKNYSFGKGIWGSPWADNFGLEHFIRLSTHPEFLNALKNTIVISFGRLIFEFPVPVILALLINEIRGRKFKRVVQTIYTFPHFLSWIIIYGLLVNLFASDGIYNQLIGLFGMEPVNILGNPDAYKPFLFISNNWKEAGYSTIIYLAAITGINPELYEAAKIDGANRWQLVKHITWPCIKPTVAIMLILAVASMMSAGFDQIFNTYNAATQDAGDIVDTLVYRLQFVIGSNFGFTTAIGLFKSVVNLLLMLVANTIVKRITGKGIY